MNIAILKGIGSKSCNFGRILKIKFHSGLLFMWVYRIVWPRDMFVKCCAGHKLSNKVFGVIIRHFKTFWCTQTFRSSWFSRLSRILFKNVEKFHVQHQKMFSWKHHVWAWGARKYFLYASCWLWWILGSCLGPRVFKEIIRLIIRDVNRFLCYQTYAGSDFFSFHTLWKVYLRIFA